MKNRLLLLAASAAALSGCYDVSSNTPPGVGSFEVKVTSISAVADSGGLQPLSVVPSCIKAHGTRLDQVPMAVRGTPDCRYIVPGGQVEMTVNVRALDKTGQYLDFNGPVAFRVVPGDVAGDYSYAWVKLTKGVGQGKLRAQHLYGEVRVWVADEPVELLYGADGQVAGNKALLPSEPQERTYAAGSSDTLHFQPPTLATIQLPQGTGVDASPFVGQFVTIGLAPEAGGPLYQNCPDIDLNGDGRVDPQPQQPVFLVVTGVDPSGFFVTDATACPSPEDLSTAAQVNVPEPGGYLPGRYGSIYIYNYSYPEGLYPGDLLWTLAGSLQEFTSTTQLTFPSWTVAEHVRRLPQKEWSKHLERVPPVELVQRHCGHRDTLATQSVDPLCGYYGGNKKLESLESGLVKLRQVRFPSVFKSCDLDGNGTVPSFCNRSSTWTYCSDTVPPDAKEVECNISCAVGTGEFQNTVCTERSQYNTYGQFIVELTGSGPTEAGLDNSLPARTLEVPLSSTASARTASALEAGAMVNLWCEQDAYVRFGGTSVAATREDTLLPARTRREVVLKAGEGSVAFLADGPVVTTPGQKAPRCYVGRNSHSRVLLITKDAVPDLKVDCSETDSDPERARQCRFLHGATYDVVGHLRQVQAARPRWMVMPRDADDLCCHPGPGLECPRPLKACQ